MSLQGSFTGVSPVHSWSSDKLIASSDNPLVIPTWMFRYEWQMGYIKTLQEIHPAARVKVTSDQPDEPEISTEICAKIAFKSTSEYLNVEPDVDEHFVIWGNGRAFNEAMRCTSPVQTVPLMENYFRVMGMKEDDIDFCFMRKFYTDTPKGVVCPGFGIGN